MKLWIIIGALLLSIAIIFGAFGSHFLKTRFSENDIEIFEIGVRYHTYQALGLLILGVMGFNINNDLIVLPAMIITTGLIIFSGSLYLLVLLNIRWLGAVTPIGGMFLIFGWALLAFNLIRS